MEEKEKMSFGNIFLMALCASLAIALLRSLKIGGMVFSGIFVAAASVLGLSLYNIFFTKFKSSNLLLLLGSASVLGFLLLSAKPVNRSVLLDYPAEPDSTQKPVSSDDSLTKMMNNFNEKQAELVKIPEKKSLVKNPYLKEKAVFYSKGISFGETDARWIFDNSYNDLNKLVAEKPEDVKTSVLKVCKQLKSETPYFVSDGNNKKEITIFYWNCDLTIIDRTISAVIYKKNFDSKPSAFSMIKYDSAEKYESPMPDNEIGIFLKKLPVK